MRDTGWPNIDQIKLKLMSLMLTKPDEQWTDYGADRAGDAPLEEVSNFNLITPNLGRILGITKTQMEARHPKSGEFVFANRVDFAKGRLVDLKYIVETDHARGRKFYRLTEEGRKWIERMTRKPPGR